MACRLRALALLSGLTILLSGCMAASPPSSPSLDSTGLKPSTVDLRNSVLSVDMPAGYSTAAVRFNVSADLWRPTFVTPTNVEDPTNNELCILVGTFGLTSTMHVAVLQLVGEALSFPAKSLDSRIYRLGDGAASCLSNGFRGDGFQSATPHDVELVLVASNREDKGAQAGGTQDQAYRFTVGIGTEPCVVLPPAVGPVAPLAGWSRCGPTQEVAIRPLLRNSMAATSAYYADPNRCAAFACEGFDISDKRVVTPTPAGDIARGVIDLTNSTGPGLVFARGELGGPAQGRLQTDVHLDGEPITASCSGMIGAGALVASVAGYAHVSSLVRITADYNGGSLLIGIADSIPVDFSQFGWTVEPMTYLRDTADAEGDVPRNATDLCMS